MMTSALCSVEGTLRVILVASSMLACVFCARQSRDYLQVDAEQTRRSRIDTQTELRLLYGAVLKFHRDNNTWPTTLHAACDLYPAGCFPVDADGAPLDYWRSAISYTAQNDSFELRSSGPDRMPRTRDDVVIEHPLDSVVSRGIAGCYRPVEGWWDSRPTVVRLNLLSPFDDGSYSLQMNLPLRADGLVWFPIARDSVLLQWAHGPHVRWIRLRRAGETLRGSVDLENLDLRGMDWRGTLRLIRTTCDE
jgi:hypothetical protein